MTEVDKKQELDESAAFAAGFAGAMQQAGFEAEAPEADDEVEGSEAVDTDESVKAEGSEGLESETEASDTPPEAEAPAEVDETAGEDEQSDTGLPLSAFDEQTIKTLLAKSAKVDELEMMFEKQSQELRRAYGKIGELNSHIKRLMRNPSQRGIKQAELRFARLEEEYPELAEALKQDLAEALAQAQVAVDAEKSDEAQQGSDAQDVQNAQEGAAEPDAQEAPNTQDEPDELQQLLQQREQQLRAEYERKLLSMRHPDWEQVAASPDFQIWLASQPPEVQQVARTSWSADELAAVFDLYKSASATMAQRATSQQADSVRKKRLEAAVPVADSGAAPPTYDERDAFAEGFRSVMKQWLV